MLLFAVVLFSCKDEPVTPPGETPPPTPPDTVTACNGHPELCERRYNEVVYPMTHNAHAYRPVFSTLSANQNFDITTQLNDGVRGLGIKVYHENHPDCGEPGLYVYHGFPFLGCEPYAKVLDEIADFMDANLSEVITITIEGSATIEQIAQGFNENGRLPNYMHTQPFNESWPTLEEMILSGKRLVVLTDESNSADEPGFHHMWTYMTDTHYSAEEAADFSCDLDRGNANGSIFLLNNFITILTPQPDSAHIINSMDFLLPRVRECMQHNNLSLIHI